MATMAKSFSQPLAPSHTTAGWNLLLLDHLEEFATLAWYLVADGQLVEKTFSRMMAQLDSTPFDASIPQVAYNQLREILITQAVAVLEVAHRDEEESWDFRPNVLGDLPDLPRLAFMLRMVVRSSETEVAKFLDVNPSEVRELVRNFSQSVPFSWLAAVAHEA
jgi:DNA-directed RNA polymerase specialized sigma24 family protein